VGGVRLAVAVVAVTHLAGRRRGLRRVQGGSADDHQTGLAVRLGTVRSCRRPGAGHGKQEVPGPPQGTSEESREQVNPLKSRRINVPVCYSIIYLRVCSIWLVGVFGSRML